MGSGVFQWCVVFKLVHVELILFTKEFSQVNFDGGYFLLHIKMGSEGGS